MYNRDIQTKQQNERKKMDTLRLINELDNQLSKIVEGNTGFLMAVAGARLALKNLRKFF